MEIHHQVYTDLKKVDLDAAQLTHNAAEYRCQ